MSSRYIPVIDFEACGLDTEECLHNDWAAVGQLLVGAFSSVGFSYLKNTGISDEDVQKVNDATARFFESPLNEKERYNKREGQIFGYIGIGRERCDPRMPRDYKELFHVDGASFARKKEEWPDDLAPGFSDAMLDFMERSQKLSLRVLHAIAVGLGLKDEGFFEKCHFLMHSKDSFTTGRTLYYPPVTSASEPGQLRHADHTDFTSISLVFQDSAGGLQVMGFDGEYVDATPIPETVLVNVGDTMQHWTKGRLKSTKHRVIIPDSQVLLKSVRRSLVYFAHPNNDVHINKPLVYKDENLNVCDVVAQEDLITSKDFMTKKLRPLWEDNPY